jgi:hypothetical protein
MHGSPAPSRRLHPTAHIPSPRRTLGQTPPRWHMASCGRSRPTQVGTATRGMEHWLDSTRQLARNTHAYRSAQSRTSSRHPPQAEPYTLAAGASSTPSVPPDCDFAEMVKAPSRCHTSVLTGLRPRHHCGRFMEQIDTPGCARLISPPCPQCRTWCPSVHKCSSIEAARFGPRIENRIDPS